MTDSIAASGNSGTGTVVDTQMDALLSRLGKGTHRIPAPSSNPGAGKTSGKIAEDNRKIEKSSRDFESILLGSWLQQAEQSFAQVPGGDGEDEDADPGKAQLQEISVQSLAGALTASGGIGLAKMISAQLKKSEQTQANHAAPADHAAQPEAHRSSAADIKIDGPTASSRTEQTSQTADRRYVR